MATIEQVETEKVRYPRAAAIDVARDLCCALQNVCERICVAGSLRRRKQSVGDVEILYIPKHGLITPPGEIFARDGNLADESIEQMLEFGVLTKRLSKTGSPAWGAVNKLAVHRSGIPVDLFAASRENWWNYLVCRTGPAESNTRIASEAKRRGWKWNPYGEGFSRGGTLAGDLEIHEVTSERDVFAFVGLPYLPPEERR